MVGQWFQLAASKRVCRALSSVRSCPTSICPHLLSIDPSVVLEEAVGVRCPPSRYLFITLSLSLYPSLSPSLYPSFSFSSLPLPTLVVLCYLVILSLIFTIWSVPQHVCFYACLASVQLSASYVTVGSTQELYTCLFRQMSRDHGNLAYGVQPAI